MPYNKEELLKLFVKEKQELVEALWNSLDDRLLPVTEEEIAFATERLKLHETDPSEGIEWADFKSKIQEKYGF